jgi:hypothetical protein
MAELIPAITHLAPPATCGQFRLDRFSPLFTHAAEFALTRVRPSYAYYYVFPLGWTELGRLAYHFDFDYGDGRDPWAYANTLTQQVALWARAHHREPGKRAGLDLHRSEGVVVVEDTRVCAVAPVHRLEGLAGEIYMLCDRVQAIAALRMGLPGEADETTVRGVLEGLLNARLMLEMDGEYLSLAVVRDRAPRTQPEERYVDSCPHETAAAHSLPHPV